MIFLQDSNVDSMTFRNLIEQVMTSHGQEITNGNFTLNIAI